MTTLEELEQYFYIACGVSIGLFVLLFVLLVVFINLVVKMRRHQTSESSNQLSRQTNMMADFCYTNPAIVPGEELSRRGFSMYSGADRFSAHYENEFGKTRDVETRSKF